MRTLDIQISVVIAVRNEAKYISAALESICTQLRVAHEVIVVDDGSTDETPEIVSRLMTRWQLIRFERSPGRGKVAAFNHGVAKTTGKYICLFAGDDIMPAGSLASRWEFTRTFSDDECVCVLAKIRTMSEKPRFHGHVVPRAKGRGNTSGQSPLMSRRMIARVFPVPDTLPNEDTWLEIAINYLSDITVVHTDIICCDWRVHDGNSYNHSLAHAQYKERMEARWRAHELFYNKFSATMELKMRSKLLRRIQCNQAYAGKSIMGILFSGASLNDRLRAVGTVNPFFYWVRRRFYGLLSGW